VSDRYDAIVVGGGILGAGMLQAIAARGWSVLGLESKGIAAGTSSKSSKLIHGGLRYLETSQFSLVRESLRERRILRQIAPDLVQLTPFLIPVYDRSSRGPWTIRAGLSLYSLLGGLRAQNRFHKLSRADWQKLDGLTLSGLRAIYSYQDGQTDDAALTAAVISSAIDLGGRFLCPAEFLDAEARGGSYHVRYRCGDREETAIAQALILTVGPWTNEIRSRVRGALPNLEFDLVQGSHIELDGVVSQGIYYVESVDDRRPLFVMPWQGKTLVGTTEKLVGHPTEIEPTQEEVDYLLRTYRRYFPERPATPLSSWAGSRVLERSNSDANGRSREAITESFFDDGALLMTIAGGKLTGYRALADQQATELARVLPKRPRRARTEELPLKSSPQSRNQLTELALEDQEQGGN